MDVHQEFLNVLDELAFRYGSDKTKLIKHPYTQFYYEFFKERRDTVRKVLEIGVGDLEEMAWTGNPNYTVGASLRMWRDYFPLAQVYGADIKPTAMFQDARIETFLCDQSNEQDLLNLIDHIGTDLDIVIEDGSHKPAHQVFTCQVLMPLLPKNVVYIIEDVGHPEIAEQLKDYDCYLPPLPNRKRRDDRLLIVRHKHGN